MISSEKEIEILERIARSKSTIRQRDLAQIIGLSLGMTNSILKRLAKKGLLQIKKINNRNIQYVVSPQGMDAITRRSYRYLKRTIKNVVYYKEATESLIQEIKNKKYSGLVFVGRSDLDFIVEHCCIKNGLAYRHVRDPKSGARAGDSEFILYSENMRRKETPGNSEASLHELFINVLDPAMPGTSR